MDIEVTTAAEPLESLGTKRFGAAFDRLALTAAPFDMSCVFAFHPTRRPSLVHDGYSSSVPRQTLSAYLHGGYLLDPFFVASIAATDDGLWRMRDLAPDQFFGSEFAGSASVHPCISAQEGALVEEIGWIVPLGSEWTATCSLMRNRGGRPFGEAEVLRLRAPVPAVAAAVRHHWTMATPAGQEGIGEVDSVLQRAFGDLLTPAQFQVVTMLLRGHSGTSIARALGITAGTVKVHRHNAYQRLDITCQADLFALFLDALEASPEGPA